MSGVILGGVLLSVVWGCGAGREEVLKEEGDGAWSLVFHGVVVRVPGGAEVKQIEDGRGLVLQFDPEVRHDRVLGTLLAEGVEGDFQEVLDEYLRVAGEEEMRVEVEGVFREEGGGEKAVLDSDLGDGRGARTVVMLKGGTLVEFVFPTGKGELSGEQVFVMDALRFE